MSDLDRTQFDSDLHSAMDTARKERPQASPQKHAAFANSVAAMVHGWSGGFGGPSVREHAASWTFTSKPYSFDDAVRLLLDEQGVIFGPLTDIHRRCWEDEYCFDDDPDDLKQLEGIAGCNN